MALYTIKIVSTAHRLDIADVFQIPLFHLEEGTTMKPVPKIQLALTNQMRKGHNDSEDPMVWV